MTHINYKKYLLAFILMIAVSFTYSQQLGPGDPNGDPEGDQDPVGGGAPIGGGVGILLVLGAAYGGRKVYKYFSEDAEELDS